MEGGFISPYMVIDMVWMGINDADELIDVRVIELAIISIEHIGNYAIPEPVTLAQAIEGISMVTVGGIDILILAADDNGSWVVMVNI